MVIERINKYREYLDYLEQHYNNVQRAWDFVKARCEGQDFRFLADDYVYTLINLDVLTHDVSKLSAEEFTSYRNFFFPVEGEYVDKDAFYVAWEHHKKHNAHHWQNWTQDPNHPYADAYLVMMILDWLAISYEKGDTAKEYYEANKDVITLPQWAETLMYKIFDCLYS